MRVEIIRKVFSSGLGGMLLSLPIHAGTFYQGDLADLTKESELVVLGEVRDVQGFPGGYWLATVRIEEVFKGAAKGTVRFQSGDTAEDKTSAAVGQRLVLFLQAGTLGDTSIKKVAWRGRGCMLAISEPKEFYGVLITVPAEIRLPPSVPPVKAPLRADGASLITVESLQRLIRTTLPKPPTSGGITLPNNPIKLSVRPVTGLACARPAPSRPAAYRVR